MKKPKRVLEFILMLASFLSLAGCARLKSGVHDLHGSIIGNEYYIDIKAG